MTFIHKEDLDAMLVNEMNIANKQVNSTGIKDNEGNYLPGCDLHRAISLIQYNTLKIVYDFVQKMEKV